MAQHSFYDPKYEKTGRTKIDSKKIQFIIFSAIIAHFIFFSAVGLLRHWGFLTSMNDLAAFDQAIWGIVNEGYLINSTYFSTPINWLGFHFQPILYAFSPLFYLVPSVQWLIFGQAAAISIAAWPILLLGKHVFECEKSALIISLCYLLNPFIINASAWDFHPISIAVPFVALAMLSVELKNFKMMLLSIFFILLCKEHFGVLVVGFGVLWWIKNRQVKKAILLVLTGIAHFYIVLKIIMPDLSPTGDNIMISGVSEFSRYFWLGRSINDIIKTVIFNPFYIIKTVLIDLKGTSYLFILFLPFLGISVLGFPYLIPASADLSANMLSLHSLPRAAISYHSATIIPILTGAAIYGTKKITGWCKEISVKQLSGLILFSNFILGYWLAPLPLPGMLNFWSPSKFISLPDFRVDEIRSLIEKDSTLSVQANVGAHFSHRKEVYRFPNRKESVDAIIVRLSSPTKNIDSYEKNKKQKPNLAVGWLESHLQMGRYEYLKEVRNLLRDKNLCVVYWNDPWLVLKKNSDGKKNDDLSDIERKIDNLMKEWI